MPVEGEEGIIMCLIDRCKRHWPDIDKAENHIKYHDAVSGLMVNLELFIY